MKVDVFVPTRNSIATIPLCLASIRRRIPVNRLIVVDGHSTDGTYEYCMEHADVVVRDGNRGVGEARQRGLELVETLVYASIDSDVTDIPYGWFNSLFPLLEDGVAVVSGVPLFGYGTCKPIELMYRDLLIDSRSLFPSLSNSLLDTNVIRKVGGFNPFYEAGEDLELMRRVHKLGYKWKINYETVVVHPTTLRDELGRIGWWSIGDVRLGYPIFPYAFKRLAYSLVTGLRLSLKHPALLVICPLRELFWLKGFLHHIKRIRN